MLSGSRGKCSGLYLFPGSKIFLFFGRRIKALPLGLAWFLSIHATVPSVPNFLLFYPWIPYKPMDLEH